MRNPDADGGSEEKNAEMDKAPFMAAAYMESMLYGMNYKEVMMCDMFRGCATWGELDDGTIDAPMIVFTGASDKTMPASYLVHFPTVYPQAKTKALEGHGH